MSRNGGSGNRVRKLARFLSKPLQARQAPTPRPRASSLPFISGDTFRAVSEVILEEGGITLQRGLSTGVIFADAPSSIREDFLQRLDHARRCLDDEDRATLIIHNGDTVPTATGFAKIAEMVPRVYSKNVLDGIPGVTPIPIGLENVALNHNGKLHYYLDAIQNPTPIEQRTRQVLSSFHVSTNPQQRGETRAILRGSRHGHEDTFSKSLDYRLAVRHAKFVISPPGNGMDCHRTWEAIYLGAVPVVLRSHLAKSLWDGNRILAVESYKHFVQLSDGELDDLYREITRRKSMVAWGHYWFDRILQ